MEIPWPSSSLPVYAVTLPSCQSRSRNRAGRAEARPACRRLQTPAPRSGQPAHGAEADDQRPRALARNERRENPARFKAASASGVSAARSPADRSTVDIGGLAHFPISCFARLMARIMRTCVKQRHRTRDIACVNFRFVGLGVLVQKSFGGHDHAVDAKSALSGLLFDEGLLQAGAASRWFRCLRAW